MWLIDTNIISELCRRQPDPGVLAWASGISEFRVSAISVEEIAYGLAWRPNPRIQDWIGGFFTRHAALPVTQEIARRAGELRGRLAAQGSPRSQADMLIAATALVHNHTLVTRNSRDFDGCGLPLLNPFSL
ncbi:MAG: type II toxin-antitoxin system VapC family toxin [Pseudomonadota bacterium]|nr:type II toxin-antitoxin system VapC family toxin [Pseudomonadota bacterium]